MKRFNYSLDFRAINFRQQPELYQVGRGEQGVLLVEPYKSEILPYWRFKTPAIAQESANTIYELFLGYVKKDDFVGMDMARKFLQMGYTWARRYANHSSGKKYASNPQNAASKADEKKLREQVLPQNQDWEDSEKAQAARIFYEKYLAARENPIYQQKKLAHQIKFEGKKA